MRRLLLLPLLAALALPAAGCGGGAPSSFADCRDSATQSGSDDKTPVLPATYDCLVRAYRDDCTPAKARIGESGVDAGADFAVRVYRRGGRCAGDVTLTSYLMGRKGKPEKLSCRQAYVFGGKLSLFGCDKADEFTFTRGEDCSRVFERMRERAERERRRACRAAGKPCPPALKQPAFPPLRLAC